MVINLFARALLVGFEDRAGIEALTLGAGDVLAGGVLFALQPFDERNEPAALGVQGGELLEVGRQIDTTARQTLSYCVAVIANISRIQHEAPQ